MPPRLLNTGIAATGLLMVAASYQGISQQPGADVRVSWLIGMGGAALLAAWLSRCTASRRRKLERDHAEATAVIESSQMATSAVNMEATLDLVRLTLEGTVGGPACPALLLNRVGA